MKVAPVLLIAALFSLTPAVYGEPSGAHPVVHPLIVTAMPAALAPGAYMSREDRKALVEQNKDDYLSALDDYGSYDDITRQAKARYDDSRKSYQQSFK